MLRDAFNATAADPLFLAAAKKAGRDISPITGEDIDRLLQGELCTAGRRGPNRAIEISTPHKADQDSGLQAALSHNRARIGGAE